MANENILVSGLLPPTLSLWREDLEIDQPRRKRKVDHTSREARLAVAPTVARCGQWQAKAACLLAIAERATFESQRLEIAAEVAALRTQIADERAILFDRIGALSERAASHGHTVDARRALTRMDDRLDEIERYLVPKSPLKLGDQSRGQRT
jgi:hypothetical protein